MAVEPPTVEGTPLGERLPEDELALDVAQARIAAKLFGVATEVVVGRYRLLELVGRGGMGVVWGAWDPELERKVAIKLVDPLRSAARDRILGEAKALAKLSHPNVVPIYDVGTLEDRVYLVMEWVAGDNLRAHLAGPHAVREIVDIYLQAARGLAAVHAAGFVHRDFKPENAIVGRDGRVRVLDFGLALSDVERKDGEIAGTPRYMAPEQARGEAPTAAVDQYALCVALREALGEPPRWIANVIARGTAERPEARFASMAELIDALGRDPARLRRRRLVAAVVLASIATAAAFALRSTATEPCAGIAALPSGLADETRARIADRLAGLGGFAATELPGLQRSLDEHERDWHAASDAACRAHAHGELTTALYERRLTCLARAQASLITAADLLAHATAETFPDARLAAGALVDPALCDRVDQSLVAPPAPAIAADVRGAESAIERARVLATAMRPDGPAVAAEARRRAEATGYAPVIAHAQLIEGRALMALQDPRAQPTLEQAMRTAFGARDDVTAVEAFARLAFVLAWNDAKRVEGANIVDPIAARLGPDGRFARLLLLNNLAVAHLATDDAAGAEPLLRAALRDWQPDGKEDDYELISIAQNLALVSKDRAESRALLGRARAEVARTFGADHPRALEIDTDEVMFVDDLARARTLEDEVCQRFRMFPHLVEQRVRCEYEAAWLADEAGDDAAARTHFAAAPYDRTAEPILAEIASRLAGPSPDAAALEHLATSAPTASVWQRIAAADAFIAAARSWEHARDRDGARRCWRRAGAVLDSLHIPAVARRVARVHSRLASAQDR